LLHPCNEKAFSFAKVLEKPICSGAIASTFLTGGWLRVSFGEDRRPNSLDPYLTLEKLAMKKSLIALAAVAATGAAFAQSSVQIDGVMDAGFQSIDYKGTKVNGFNGNGSTTSQINFRGVSDLGGGLKADFRVESDWNTVSNSANTGAKKSDGTLANGASFGNGEIRTGLAGGFGKVQFGAINNNTLIANLTGQPFGTAIGSAHGSIIRSNSAGTAVRSDNSFQYISPVFSGFDVSYLQANAQSKANSANFSSSLGGYQQAGVKEASVSYTNGPLAARFTNLKQDNSFLTGTTPTYNAGLPNQNTTTNTLGANYALGDAKVFLWNQSIKADDNTQNSAGTTVSATYTMGATVLMAQAGSVKAKAGTWNGQSSKLSAVGVDYNLSKTTALYGRYESIKDNAHMLAAATTIDGSGNTRTRLGLGIRTAF
jgi:predicted porin